MKRRIMVAVVITAALVAGTAQRTLAGDKNRNRSRSRDRSRSQNCVEAGRQACERSRDRIRDGACDGSGDQACDRNRDRDRNRDGSCRE